MKNPTFSSLFATVFMSFVATLALLLAGTPVSALAQPYYGNYSYQGQYQSCLALTEFQGPGSMDSYTYGQVTQLQQFLNQTGYLSGVSGTYDNGTLGAVINYQQSHNIPITGTVGPITRSVINQQSCGSGYQTPYSYPVTGYANGNNCYWTGSVYNSTYVCTNNSIVPVAPVIPIPTPIVCNSWNNGYGNYNNYGNNCNPYNNVVISSLSASYNYNTVTITLQGNGFSQTGNTVYFGNTLVSGVYSSNGSTLTFTVPVGYNSGTYAVMVKNAQNISSNSLSFILNNSSWNNNYNWNNGYNSNNPVSLSNISGPSIVQTGVANVWTVSVNGANYGNTTLTASWGDVYSNSGSDIQQSYGNGNQTFSFSHVYQAPGTYTLRITATNPNGTNSYVTYLVTVNGNGNQYYYQY